jgi:glutathione synthase/RimK-type ligase-like ATP-grasp enzyme
MYLQLPTEHSLDKHVAFITAPAWPALYSDDLLAVAALEALHCQVSAVSWHSCSNAALERFDAIVVRSPWDWFNFRDHFRDFLTRLGQLETRVFNPPTVLQAFADKTYLPRLAAEGVPIVPTLVLTPAQLPSVPGLLAAHGWEVAVLKPAFTGGAFEAHRFARADAAATLAQLSALPDHERWLLQPFLPQIAGGEWSFLFFGGAFSHAVKKVPLASDWRVQSLHGGLASAEVPPPALVRQAASILAQAAPDTLYARVDGLVLEGILHLMELEVVEPELFFRLDPAAPGRFARALVGRLEA